MIRAEDLLRIGPKMAVSLLLSKEMRPGLLCGASYVWLPVAGAMASGPVLAAFLSAAGIPVVQGVIEDVMPYVRSRSFYRRRRALSWALFLSCGAASVSAGSAAALLLLPSAVFWDRTFARRLASQDLREVLRIMGS